jgi:hypothetical protein
MSRPLCSSLIRLTSIVSTAICGVVLSVTSAGAQVVNPATQTPPASQVVNPATQVPPPASQTPPQQPTDPQTPVPPPDMHLRSFEMPPVTVQGTAPLKEEDLIGDYHQPRWTAARRFGETRIYVVPDGTAEFEYWLIPERLPSGVTTTASMYEVEFGLPHRFQLDLYAVGHQTGGNGTYGIDGQQVEVRYALADWGKLFGNPTLYAEWKNLSGVPSHFEGKLLLGGQITSRWHWGSNFVWEHEMGGVKENSNEWTTGVSYAVADTKASVGMETQLALVNHETLPGTRSPFSTEFLIGPSIQFRPLPQVHLDLAPLFGVTSASSRVKLFVVFGWEF